MPLDTYHNQEKNKLIAIVVTLLVVVGLVVLIGKLDRDETNAASTAGTSTGTSQTATQPPSTAGMATGSANTSTYKDGTYTASAEYYVPHGYEDIKVTLTLQNGAVANAQVVNSESDRESARFQQDFAASYKSLVVGKSLDTLNLSRVSGASDTTDGFNSALQQIKQQAHA